MDVLLREPIPLESEIFHKRRLLPGITDFILKKDRKMKNPKPRAASSIARWLQCLPQLSAATLVAGMLTVGIAQAQLLDVHGTGTIRDELTDNAHYTTGWLYTNGTYNTNGKSVTIDHLLSSDIRVDANGNPEYRFRLDDDGNRVLNGFDYIHSADPLGTIKLSNGKSLTLKSGDYWGTIELDSRNDRANLIIENAGYNYAMVLRGASFFEGTTEIRSGTLQVMDKRALGWSDVDLQAGATLRVGGIQSGTDVQFPTKEDSENMGNIRHVTHLQVARGWKAADASNVANQRSNLELVLNGGDLSSVSILNNASKIEGMTYIHLVYDAKDLNKLGGAISSDENMVAGVLVKILGNKDDNLADKIRNNFVLVDDGQNLIEADSTTGGFETSRYGFLLKIQEGKNYSSQGGFAQLAFEVQNQDIVVPDLSTMVLTSIIGFEIPRTQNVNGPWARIRGGEINDDRAHFDNTTYQSLQIGWDKNFKAANSNGSWNAGIFFEGDWSYGTGDWLSKWETIEGKLKSKANGAGAGLYVSRAFQSGVYIDIIGRLNVFDNEVSMTQTNKILARDMINDYRGKWSSSLFNLALEFGKDFKSRNGKWTFNPYERVIYTSAPDQEFDVIFGDDSVVEVRNASVDAWTNKLGARLAYNSQCAHRKTTSIFYIGADYYQGLSGDFATWTNDTLNSKATWQRSGFDKDGNKVDRSRTKNDLAYGTATFGMTILPRETVAITAETNVLFGDVDGWSVGMSGKVSF